MELSPEDKARIEAEERYRREVRLRIDAEASAITTDEALQLMQRSKDVKAGKVIESPVETAVREARLLAFQEASKRKGDSLVKTGMQFIGGAIMLILAAWLLGFGC